MSERQDLIDAFANYILLLHFALISQLCNIMECTTIKKYSIWRCRIVNKFIIILQIKVREYRRGNQKGQSRETGNYWSTQRYKDNNDITTRRRQTKHKHNTICIGHHVHYTQTSINNLNKTCALLQIIDHQNTCRDIF